MSKRASLVLLLSYVLAVAGTLTGCSASALPGKPTPNDGSSTAPIPEKIQTGPVSQGLIATPTACPAAPEVSGLVGFTVLNPRVQRKTGALECTYDGTAASDVMEITFRAVSPDMTEATLRSEIQKVAGIAQATIAAVSGFGRAAYTISNAGGSGILVFNRHITVTVVDGEDVASVEQVAAGVLTG